MADNIHFLGDNPISKSEEDLFNFKHYADKVQKLIQLNSSNLDAITIGIHGKWGEGKTSFLNLIKNKIEHFEKDENGKEYLEFNFNPWRYSSEEEMLFDFFDALSKKFYVKQNTNLQEAGKWITKYSKYLKAIKISSTVGIPKTFDGKVSFDISEIFESLGKDLSGKELTLEALKVKVNEAIIKANFKVIVFVDDLDRLDKDEIYTILKLIKLNADFANFIFIINLDSEQVSKAIGKRYGEQKDDGKQFLEKIINIPIYLPKIEREDLRYFFELKLKKILNNFPFLTEENNSQLLRDISSDISIVNFNSPREIIKILNSFFTTGFTIGEEINLEDLFWLEFIKIRNENCYNFLKQYEQNMIFSDDNFIIDFKEPTLKNKYEYREKILEEFSDVKSVLERLFPKTEGFGVHRVDPSIYIKNLKINSIEHYDKYFSYHIERKISNKEFEQIELLVKAKDSEGLKGNLERVFTNLNISKSVGKIEILLRFFEIVDERNFFFINVFQSLKLIPDFQGGFLNLDYKIRLVENIAKILNNDFDNKGNEIDNSIVVIELGGILDLNELCFFVRKFHDSHLFKNELIGMLISKTKTYINEFPKFFHDPHNLPNKSIFYYLGKMENSYLDDFLKKNIENIEDIKYFIRNFAPFWNNSFFGGIEERDYDYMKELFNLDFIFEKISEFNFELVEKIDIETYEFSRTDESSMDENLEQFIFWYKKRKDLVNKIDKIIK